MNITEKYTIVFGDLNPAVYNRSYLENEWKKTAALLNMQTGVSISTIIKETTITCSEITGCMRESEYCLQAVCVRNLVLNPNKQLYYDTLRKLIIRMKHQLGEPYTAIMMEQVQFSFFQKQ